ncbi:M20/M25/M40 family metallo-hydrolase [Pararhodobacter zhoushanensis]|uniref:M20/M25/M40 family metallo-hydrolase n=1 Tax=Pararhodobacter zhoushanensis TaxID=2479545 RepID=UPI000F8F8264|nr:M20/M25/M40 family metallo-hydrolase [Pararhodobacter zhoushanensis]
MTQRITAQPVIDALLARQDSVMARLDTLLRFKSVSTDSAFNPEMARTRDFLCDWLREIGMKDVQLLDGGGHPAIYAAWEEAGPDVPTVVVYGHYDVQPAGPDALWRTPAFEPTVVGDRLYARGASDVKGSTVIAIETLAGYLQVHGRLPINVKLFLEGEEESGSPSLGAIIEKFRPLLKADAMISADGGRASPVTPTINVGARGLTALEITLRTADKETHSGRYGGSIRNALHEMARLVTSLHNADGSVAVEGLRALARPITNAQRANAAALPFDEAAFVADVGAIAAGEPGLTIRERLTLFPAIDVNGMWGGYTGEGGKTVIPDVAHAKITARLSPGIDPDAAQQVLRDHLSAACAEGVELSFAGGHGAPASNIEADHPLVKAARTVLLAETGEEPVLVRLGATVPITAVFSQKLDMDTLMFGMNLPDEDVHAPNEFFHLDSIPLGLRLWPALLEELAAYSPADFRTATDGSAS